ncbi:MAG: oligosaccharide repeat unit polymerase [Melioribacter sp.]|nr:oligosaccharide repeat unit polymerase [Melioribacter sp.]
MTFVSFICFGIFVLLMISLFKKDTDVFSPARLFVIIWSLAIGLTDLKLSRYQIIWTDFSWIMILISLFSMLTGMFIVYVINIDKPVKKIDFVRNSFKENFFDSSKLFRYVIFLFQAYIVSYIVSALVIGFVPLFTLYPGVARNDWGIFGFGLFVQSFPAIIYLIILYYIITKGQRKEKILLAFIFFVTSFTYALLLQRYYVVFAIILSAVSMYYMTNLLRLKNVLVITVIIMIVIFSMTFVRLTGTISNYLYYLSDMKFNVKYALFTEPYMYVAMNLENYAHSVDKINNFTYGIFSFDFVFALAGIKHQVVEYLRLPKYPFLLSNNYNTYTMFFIYYWDFGILGLGLIPMMLGALFSKLYYKMRRNPNLNTISVYSIFSFVIIFSFFIPIISFLHFAFNLLIIYFVTKKITAL